MLGILAVGRGDLETAEREVDRAVELQPYRGDALVALAWLAEQRGDHARAQELLRETLRFEPDNRLARRRLDQPAAP
jgi:Tfp pilus assembly protein PilF